MKFIKRPFIIEAMQFDGTHVRAEEIINWVNSYTGYKPEDGVDPPILFYYGDVTIVTPFGKVNAKKWDWIIRGRDGEFYPCKPDTFKKTYKEVK
jgi:hypothetical protein